MSPGELPFRASSVAVAPSESCRTLLSACDSLIRTDEATLPSDTTIAALVRRLWNADTGEWRKGDLDSLADVPDARVRPVTEAERRWFGTEDYAALHVPLLPRTRADVVTRADAFRAAAEVVTGVLGPAALLAAGCWLLAAGETVRRSTPLRPPGAARSAVGTGPPGRTLWN